MLKSLIYADFLKIKRKGFWLLTFLGPFGVVALQMVNYGVRKEYLLEQSDNYWEYYLLNVSVFTPFALILGIVILTSLVASIENETNAWKQLIAFPVSKLSVYLSKFTVLAFFLFVSSLLLIIFTLGYGIFLDFGEQIPYIDVIKQSIYSYLAAMPVLALQLWVATVSRNQGIPITIGVLGVIFSYLASSLPDWMIWKWPSLINEWGEPFINALLGIGFGCFIYIIGMLDFVRRDVK